jgi:site-specific DNA recombinase
MQAVIYARVSSKEQEREGFSIPAQLELLREYAKRNGLEIAQEYSEAETAKTAGRERFGEMLALLRSRTGPKILLVEKTDRLYRNWKDYVAVEDLMQDHGVRIHLVKEGELLSRDAQSHVKFIHGIKALMAKNYIDNLSEETRKGMLQKAKEGGWPTAPPYGYRMENGRLVPDEDQAVFVRTAFQRYATGAYSIRALSKLLKSEGLRFLPSLPTVPKSNLERMLKRRVYIGDVEFKGEIYPGKHPPLVSMDTWIMAQKALKKDNKPMKQAKHVFRYRGIFTCWECGSLLTGDAKKGGRYTYYRCTNSTNQGGCGQKHVSESVIDEAVAGVFARLQVPPDFRESIAQAVRELDDLKQADEDEESNRLKRSLDSLRRRLRTAYDDKLKGTIDEDMWQQVSRDYKDQILEIEERITQVAQADLNYYELANMLLELPEKLNTSWLQATDEEKAVLMKLIYSNCKLKDGNPLLELHPVFDYLLSLSKLKNGADDGAELQRVIALHSVTIKALHASFSDIGGAA